MYETPRNLFFDTCSLMFRKYAPTWKCLGSWGFVGEKCTSRKTVTEVTPSVRQSRDASLSER